MKIINCTPHPVVVLSEQGKTVFEPSGNVPRLETATQKGEKYWRVLVHPDTYQYYTLKFCAFCHAAFERKRQKVYI